MEKFKRLVKLIVNNITKHQVTSLMAVVIPALVTAGYLNPEMKDEFILLGTSLAMIFLGTSKDALK